MERGLTRDGLAPVCEVRDRRVLFVTCGCGVLLSFLLPMQLAQIEMSGTWVARGITLTTSLLSLFVVVRIMCKQRLSDTFLVTIISSLSVAFALSDLHTRGTGNAAWPLFVLMVDLLLVLRIDHSTTTLFVLAFLAWLFLMTAEASYRFGIFDMPGLISQSSRDKYYAKLTDCDKPPCALGLTETWEGFLIAAATFVLDFLATRSFARQVLEEQKAMQRTIETVQEVTRLLAGYDVDGVARVLYTKRTELPVEMHETLARMEENLRQYRSYLPAALFEVVEQPRKGVSEEVQDAPGSNGAPTTTLVFTDICSSTSIWEAVPDAMLAALSTHNTLIRDLLRRHNGYEVKTIGDAFMIAFHSTSSALGFALRVQEALFEAEWPETLLDEVPICAKQGLWGGLTVRIGINTGPVALEQNVLTGRADYFGHTVNLAARLESSCAPGAVAVRTELMEDAEHDLDIETVREYQNLDLKGVSGGTSVCHLWPASLAGRMQSALQLNASTSRGLSEMSRITSVSIERGLVHTMVDTVDVTATVGMVELAGLPGEDCTLQNVTLKLSQMRAALVQSGGVVVSMLGSGVSVGWNLTWSTSAHLENAVRFAQRVRNVALVGLCSGFVQYGTVGSRLQRFVTVLGPPVQRSVALCAEAVREDVSLFVAEADTLTNYLTQTCTAAVESLLAPHPLRVGVYVVCEESLD